MISIQPAVRTPRRLCGNSIPLWCGNVRPDRAQRFSVRRCWLKPATTATRCVALTNSPACTTTRGLQRRAAERPQIPGANGTIGTPRLSGARHPGRRRQFAQAVGKLEAVLQPQVVHRQHVTPAEAENQKHLRRPAPNALYLREVGDHVFVAEPRKSSEQQLARLCLFRQITQVADFLLRKPGGAKCAS